MKRLANTMAVILIIIALVGCNKNIESTTESTTTKTIEETSTTTEEVTTTTKEVTTTTIEVTTTTQSITTTNNVISHTQSTILTGTIWETDVHYFESSVSGPRVAIVGGIHGDEIAGWNAALELLNREDFIGSIMIIPKANKLACEAVQRYPGLGKDYNGYTYSDLNRTFPGKEDGTVTEKISYAIANAVKDFNPDHVIDLHESLHSYSYGSKYIGNQIIYGNSYSNLIGYDIVDDFNNRYLIEGEDRFCVDTYAPGGSFNSYFGALYPKSCVFTIETNRELVFTRRVEQQLQLLDCMFNYFWYEI